MNLPKHAIAAIILLSLLLAACQPAIQTAEPTVTAEPSAPAAPLPTETDELPADEDPMSWWNEVVFYEIFVRSFKDSDGDGIGDFQGIISQLDYLNDGQTS